MTTAINDISDLARILRENPEWADTLRSLLLAREILDLPTALAELTQVVNDFIREQREINERADARVARLEQVVNDFIREQREINERTDARLARLEQTVNDFIQEQRETNQRTDARLARLEEIADRSEQRLTRLEEIADRSEQRLTRLEEIADRSEQRLTRLEEIAASTNERVANLETTTNRMQGQLGLLLGADAERRIQGNLAVILSQRMRLRRAVSLKSIISNIDRSLAELLEDAEDNQTITPEQHSQVRLLDVILYATDRETAAPVYIAVEVSITLHQEDIDRAAERAAILEKAAGITAKAVVVCGRVSPPQETQAAAAGVAIILVEDLTAAAAEG